MKKKFPLKMMMHKAKQASKSGEIEEALSIYDKILKRYPFNTKASLEMQKLSNQMTTVSEAEEEISQLIKLYKNGFFTECLDLGEVLSKKYPKEINILNILGVCFFATGKNLEAVKCFQKLLTLDVNHFNGWFNLGNVYSVIDNIEAASNAYKKAIGINSTSSEAHYNLANLYQKSKMFAEALEYFENAIKHSPNKAEYYNNKGIVLSDLGEEEKAIVAYKNAIRLSPHWAEAHHNLATSYGVLRHFENAILSYQRAIKLEPKNARSHHQLGLALDRVARYTEAIRAFKNAISHSKQFPEAYNDLGNSWSSVGCFDDAIVSFEVALKQRPDYWQAMQNLGNAQSSLGLIERAKESFRQALSINPSRYEVKHCLDALEGVTSEKPPDSYITSLFDRYAKRFDNHLIKDLGYDAPSLLRQELYENINKNQKFLRAVDLGCGTGLSGKAFRDCSICLTGVDLSSNMIEEANRKKIYDHLIHSNFVDSLQTSSCNYDLFIAADSLIYLGDLYELFFAIKEVSAVGSLFCFTTEHARSEKYYLNITGRYKHSYSYVHNLACRFSFVKLGFEEIKLRKENNKWITGAVYIYRTR